MKRVIIGFFLLLIIANTGFSQSEMQSNPLKVALVSSIYLDSAFHNGLVKSKLPSYVKPGLDFIQGAQIALDTLQINGQKLEVSVYDTRSIAKGLDWEISNGTLKNTDLIITSARQDEFEKLAGFAKEHKIPLISAVYPNAAAVNDNPYLVILNSTLNANIQGVYSYIVQQHSSDPVFLLKTPGDDRVYNYFNEININNHFSLKNIKLLETKNPDSIYLSKHIDTSKMTIIIGGTLDKSTAIRMANGVSKFKNVMFIGMPNWEDFKELYSKKTYQDFPFYYPSPHFVQNTNPFYHYLANSYFTQYRIGPTDMAERGFEAVYKFVNILLKYPKTFMDNINDNHFNSLHKFNILAHKVSHEEGIDYYENKHISIIQILNGKTTLAE